MKKLQIKEISHIEHVLKKPGMYVGDVSLSTHIKWILNDDKFQKQEISYVPAVLKLFDEIVSNSIDEAIRTEFKHATKIAVKIKGDSIEVSDNGRGIPDDVDPGKTKSYFELAFTSLMAGSNFDEQSHASIGTHGLGASLVNILSTKFKAVSTHNQIVQTLTCSDNMSKIKSVKSKVDNALSGTKVIFTPDFNRFGVNSLDDSHAKLIQKRLIDLAVAFPQISFKFNGKLIKAKNFRSYLSMFSDTFEFIETDDYRVAVMTSETPDQISFVNGIDTYDGGTHVDFVRNSITSELLTKLKRKYKKLDLKPADIKNHTCFVVITNNILNAKFRSQTKEYLTNNPSEFNQVFNGITDTRFINKIIKNPDLIDPIIETKKLKNDAADRVAAKKKQRQHKKIKIAKYVPAAGASNKHILHICEGDSALGSLVNVRDPFIHAGFPLRGKPLNVYGKKPIDILANKELSELMAIIGLQFGTKANNINFAKIRIMADADHDGNAITGLLINFFALWPELFENKIIEIVKSPIVIARKGKQSKRYYSFEEYENDFENVKDWKIKYNKGLGKLSPEEYAELVHYPKLETIEWTAKSRDALNLVFDDNPDNRKIWLTN